MEILIIRCNNTVEQIGQFLAFQVSLLLGLGISTEAVGQRHDISAFVNVGDIQNIGIILALIGHFLGYFQPLTRIFRKHALDGNIALNSRDRNFGRKFRPVQSLLNDVRRLDIIHVKITLIRSLLISGLGIKESDNC